MANYREEFPDFPASDMPVIPEGFIDESWHNDAMPTFRHPAKNLSIYVDFADPARRENPDWEERFHVAATSDEGEFEPLLSTNDWSAVEKLVNEAPVREGYGS